MRINRETFVVGQFNPVSRKSMKWDVKYERTAWISGCGSFQINRHGRDSFYVEPMTRVHIETSLRVSDYPSKKAAVHFCEHVVSPNENMYAARTFAAPVMIDWKRAEAGIYKGSPAIISSTNRRYECVTLEQTPDGWFLRFDLDHGWWRWYGECLTSVPEHVVGAVEKGKTRRFKSKKEASVAAEYAVRDILGHWSRSFGFARIPDSLDKWFAAEDTFRDELKALVGEAAALGMCEEMFLAHVFAHAARNGLPSVVECVESAKALMAVWREHGK